MKLKIMGQYIGGPHDGEILVHELEGVYFEEGANWPPEFINWKFDGHEYRAECFDKVKQYYKFYW